VDLLLVYALVAGALAAGWAATWIVQHRRRGAPIVLRPHHVGPPPPLELRDVFERLQGARLFRVIMASVQIAVIIADEWGRILALSASAERLFGYDERELLGLPITELMPTEYRQRHTEAVEVAWRTKQYRLLGQTLDVHGLHKDGQTFPITIGIERETANGTVFLIGYIRLRKETDAPAA
jgi:PAS domain S-box-containing protein